MPLRTQNTSPVISALGSPGPVRAPSLGVGGWCWLGHRLPIGWCYWDYPIVPISLYHGLGLLAHIPTAAFLTFLTCCCCCCAAPPAMLLAPAPAPAPGCCCCLWCCSLLPLLLTCILLLLLLLVLLRFALGFGQLTIFHIKQQVFSLKLRNEVQFQSQNEKTGLCGVFFGPF